MSHWESIAVAYALTIVVLAAELVLLRRRRQRAERLAREAVEDGR